MRGPAAAWLALGLLATAPSCTPEPPIERGPEPMRVPAGGRAPTHASGPATADTAPAEPATEARASASAGSNEDRRPQADPAIERALERIAASELRFVDQADEPGDAPTEYTAEQFAAMLRTKWEWLGYDLTELGPWLDAIASRSFKTNLPYLVVLADGRTVELRGWLDAELAASAPTPPAP